MNKNLSVFASLFIIFVIFLVLYYIKNRKISIKYASLWIILFSLLLVFLLLPGFLVNLVNFLGFEIASNMILTLLIGVLVLLNISFTAILTSQDRKIRKLIQEVSLLKRKNNE